MDGWWWFTRVHAIEVGHFVVFKYDSHDMLTVKVFDETICHHHYHTDEDDWERARQIRWSLLL
jgi:hypothetical protein